MVATDTRAKDQAKAELEAIQEMVERLRNGNEKQRQRASEEIQQDALSVEVRSGWRSLGEGQAKDREYRILLSTGGPAARITGDLGSSKEPDSATLEYKDGFTLWRQYDISSEDEKILLAYARVFYYGS